MQILTNHYQFWGHFFIVLGTESSWRTLSVPPPETRFVPKSWSAIWVNSHPSNKNYRSFKLEVEISEKALTSAVRSLARQRWESLALPAPVGSGHLARASGAQGFRGSGSASPATASQSPPEPGSSPPAVQVFKWPSVYNGHSGLKFHLATSVPAEPWRTKTSAKNLFKTFPTEAVG